MAILRWSHATRMRVLAARPQAGRVHSVFERAVNILWHDGRLLTLHGPEPLAAPFAVALARLPRGAHPGRVVRHCDDRILCGADALIWGGASQTETTVHPTSEAVDMLAAVLKEPGRPRAALSLGSAAGRMAESLIVGGIRSGTAVAFVNGARALVGLGEGLTPAGDDCLVGALVMLHRFARPWLASHPEIPAAIAAAVEDGTTIVGREFILHALDGSFSEVILRLVTAASRQDARHAAARLLATGGTSGADTLHGMRLALEALRR